MLSGFWLFDASVWSGEFADCREEPCTVFPSRASCGLVSSGLVDRIGPPPPPTSCSVGLRFRESSPMPRMLLSGFSALVWPALVDLFSSDVVRFEAPSRDGIGLPVFPSAVSGSAVFRAFCRLLLSGLVDGIGLFPPPPGGVGFCKLSAPPRVLLSGFSALVWSALVDCREAPGGLWIPDVVWFEAPSSDGIGLPMFPCKWTDSGRFHPPPGGLGRFAMVSSAVAP